MKHIIYYSKNFEPREILSKMIKPIIKHLKFSPDQSIKEYLIECYKELYTLKSGKIHASRQKELDYTLKLSGDQLKQKVCDLYNNGLEDLDGYKKYVNGRSKRIIMLNKRRN